MKAYSFLQPKFSVDLFIEQILTLGTYYVPGTILSSGDTVNKPDKNLILRKLCPVVQDYIFT